MREGERMFPFSLFYRYMKRTYLLFMLVFGTTFAWPSKVKADKVFHELCTCQTITDYTICNNFALSGVASDTVVHRKHRFIAAILAFPIPFGIFGLHRIYLGTSTGVPFLYIATLGGALGILPFVDFVIIVLCKNVNTYAHNPAVFMWTRKKH